MSALYYGKPVKWHYALVRKFNVQLHYNSTIKLWKILQCPNNKGSNGINNSYEKCLKCVLVSVQCFRMYVTMYIILGNFCTMYGWNEKIKKKNRHNCTAITLSCGWKFANWANNTLRIHIVFFQNWWNSLCFIKRIRVYTVSTSLNFRI